MYFILNEYVFSHLEEIIGIMLTKSDNYWTVLLANIKLLVFLHVSVSLFVHPSTGMSQRAGG